MLGTMFVIDSKIDRLIRQAIREKRLLRFLYAGKERIVEPHDYGVQNGKVRLLSYQIGGESNSGTLPAWRWIDVDRLSDIHVEERRFKGSRGPDSTQHHKWDQLYARVA
jgi:predicted DNA-binding transcriptional regulator YafY